MGRLYLGLDSSTQSLTAIVIEVDAMRARVAFEASFTFDQALPQYQTTHGVLSNVDPTVVQSSPLLWADGLDLILKRVRDSGLDLSQLVAISGSAQQHGSVYLSHGSTAQLGRLDPTRAPGEQIAQLLSRSRAPVWMDSSTSAECAAISTSVGGAASLARHTGSRAFERFTGPQIRKFAVEQPDAYGRTERIHLVSSFLASVLIGGDAPVDPGDASGMNLMDLQSKTWWDAALNATATELRSRLPAIEASSTVVGALSDYWQQRHQLPAAKVIAWSGDNPCSLVGVGLVDEGQIAISLGTSDTIFGLMKEPRVDPGGTGHVFGAPTGDYMGLTCFSNGSLARERVRDRFGMTWADFSHALDTTPPGNEGRVMLPWFVPEITPAVSTPGVRRYRLNADDAASNVRAVVEAQQIAMALHSSWMGVKVRTIQATGGAAVNMQVLQVMADVFGADVYQSTVTNSAALGAALRAWHADALASGTPLSWDAIATGLEQPAPTRITADAGRHGIYRTLIPIYEACERHAVAGGKDPTFALEAFAVRT